jgi:atypical dual specificity phosphatase
MECRRKRDSGHGNGNEENVHLTILNAKERKSNPIRRSACRPDLKLTLETSFSIIGLGSISIGNDQVFYLICHYPGGDLLRKNLKLPEKDFHITLGFSGKDVHDQRKGISTLSHPVAGRDWIEHFLSSIRDSKVFIKKYVEILEYILSLEEQNADAMFLLAKLFAVNGDHSRSLAIAENLLALDLAKAYFIQLKVSKYLGLPLEDIFYSIKSNLRRFRIGNCSTSVDLIKDILKELNKFEGHSAKHAYVFNPLEKNVTLCKIPHNLSMIDEKVGGSGMITNQNIDSVILHYNFKDVITLTEDPIPIQIQEQYSSQIKFHFFPIRDRYPPEEMETMISILDVIASSPKVLVHCLGGVGRTNTVIACYLIKFKGLSPAEAMSFIDGNRKMKLSGEQVSFIKGFYGNEQKPIASLSPTQDLPKLIMLVGSPCSGKSTLSEKLIEKYGRGIVHINQDELGKKECIRFFIENLKGERRIVLDRCNGTVAQRKEWLDLIKNGASNSELPLCIYFQWPLAICEERLLGRKVHLTLSGPRGIGILRAHYKALEPPALTEGFSKIIKVSDSDSYSNLLKYLNLPEREPALEGEEKVLQAEIQFIKFPRTRHAINLGSATRDDLIMTHDELQALLSGPIIVEEKIDGANLGISIDGNGKILFQNRSHYVNEGTHPQFKLLSVWAENHREDLAQILEPIDQVLFGEWVYAKHSIPYSKLPDYFLVYDLYTISTKSFAAREELDRILERTGLHQVPKICEGVLSKEELVRMVESRVSDFGEEIIEGVYLRKSSRDLKGTEARGKVVRVGFIPGNQHWTKYKVQRNIVREAEEEEPNN